MFKVLIVDDDSNILTFMERLLVKKFSCSVSSAQNGMDALNLIKYNKPDVIFLDITMPVMDGVQTLQALRANEETKDINVIMLTAVNDKDIINEVMEIGIIDYLLKPLMFDTTFTKIKELFLQIRSKQSQVNDNPEENNTIEDKNNNKDYFLIIDTDPKFRENLSAQLKDSFNVIETANGTEGLEMFKLKLPKTVCVGEKIPFTNELAICKNIRMLDKELNIKTTIYAVRENVKLEKNEKELFDMVIPKEGGFWG